ncbi:MAG: hypothetical protein NT049_02290, partial [Planctomycetota bacterium]|nr:hypothetical protein [Planctomycetota bacterium]
GQPRSENLIAEPSDPDDPQASLGGDSVAENTPPAPDVNPEIQIVVPDALRNPHELVRLTKEYLETAAASSGSGASQDDKKRVLNVKVSRQSRSRALRIMDVAAVL